MDYEDFLRQRELVLRERNDPRRQELINRRPATADDVARWVKEVCEREEAVGGGSRGGGLGGQGGQVQPGRVLGPVGPVGPREPLGPGGAVKLGGQWGLKSTRSTQSTASTPSARKPPPGSYAEYAANAALVLIDVACGLLGRQLAARSEAFEEEGGFTERLYRQRQARKNIHD